MNYGEEPQKAIIRELMEETNLKGNVSSLFGVYGNKKRDPRKHVVTIVYQVLVEDFSMSNAGDDAKCCKLFSIKEILQN